MSTGPCEVKLARQKLHVAEWQTKIFEIAGPCAQIVLDPTSTGQCCSLNSFDMRCPRAHIDLQVVPRRLFGAYSVPPWCLPGAASHLSTWSRSHLWAFTKVLGARVGCTSALNGRHWIPHKPPKAPLGAFSGAFTKVLGARVGCTAAPDGPTWPPHKTPKARLQLHLPVQ